MGEPFNIQYIRRGDIDVVKWDHCIENASNGLIYAYSFYLDAMTKHWDALVLNDYEAVMPVTWNKKYGIAYLYQPFLTAELGVFGKIVTGKMYGDFITAIPSKFKYIDISLNSGHISFVPSGYSFLRLNHILDLNKPYEKIYSNYNDNTQRNIKKAMLAGCTVQNNFSVEKVTELAIRQMKLTDKEVYNNIERFRKLYAVLHHKQMTNTYGVFLEEKLLASAVFFYSHNRSYYILVGNSPDGRATGASHALIDAFIKDHAGKKITLDFEGSDIPTLSQFYKSFGAVEIAYPHLKINRLPFLLKWMKR